MMSRSYNPHLESGLRRRWQGWMCSPFAKENPDHKLHPTMWPFFRKTTVQAPPNIISGDDRAWFSTTINQWEFKIDGTSFTLSGREFDSRAFTWAREAISSISRLESEIDRHVLEVLDGSPFDVATRHILSVRLDDYSTAGSFDIAYVGDDSWADFGVNVIVANGKVIEAYGGD